MTVLVLGGTGTVGSQVVRELLGKGVSVGVVSRDPAKAKRLHANATVLQGDLMDPTLVRSVFKGYDSVFMANAVSSTELQEALQALNGARICGVKSFVYLSIHNVDHAPHLPHFAVKIPVEAALKDSGMSWTILRPNNFYQNDYWYKEAMFEYGIYPQPIGSMGMSRVDTRDIAEAAVVALTTNSLKGKTINLVGPEPLTAQQTVDTWSRALGKQLNYAGEDMDQWEKMNSQWLPPYMAFDFRLMYEFFLKHGLKATPVDVDQLTKILGHPPRRFADFVNETVKIWKP